MGSNDERRSTVRIGIFLPTGNNGWISSTTAPLFMPTWELNRSVTQRAEALGFDFALSMVTFRGYGGATEHWNYTVETTTQAAALAAVTSRIKLYASVGILSLHPAMVARMAATIDDIAPGRFGINIVTGWHREEYAQMGLWPDDDYFSYRYDYATEYVTVLQELWSTGRSNFTGKYFQLDDCMLGPVPAHHVDLISAGASPRGRRFAAEFTDFNFTMGHGVEGLTKAVADVTGEAALLGRDVKPIVQRLIIMDDTDELARRLVDQYNAGSDTEALDNERGHYAIDKTGGSSKVLAESINPHRAIDPDGGNVLIGSPATIAARLNEINRIEGLHGLLVLFDDFVAGLDRFGDEVIPLLDFDLQG
jgi:pyrimidine oxygenase